MDYVLASYLAWQGEPVRRKSWPQDVYVCLKGASPHIFVPKTTPTVWHSTREDFKATDYERYHTGLCRSNRALETGEDGDPEVLATQPDPGEGQPTADSA